MMPGDEQAVLRRALSVARKDEPQTTRFEIRPVSEAND